LACAALQVATAVAPVATVAAKVATAVARGKNLARNVADE